MSEELTGLEKAQEILRKRREEGVPLERLDPIEKARRNPQSLRAAINAKCWDCSCAQRVEIRRCPVTDCPLHHLRPYK